LCISTAQFPIHVEIREESNTQYDFLTTVVLAIRAGFLKSGDFLVVDNACIHGGAETVQLLIALLNSVNIQLIFLPKYSPELNPCELVFNVMKSYLRYHRNRKQPIWLEVLHGLAQIKLQKIIGFYSNCICFDKISSRVALF